jgi:glycosyltransferase involved in cell wall biosynthesis
MNDRSQSDQPTLTVVIPCKNSQKTLDLCLAGISEYAEEILEILVIDDGSVIPIAQPAEGLPLTIHRLELNRGPAFARNFGAGKAAGEILLFIDSDVVPSSNIFRSIRSFFQIHPEASAIQGIYSPEISCGSIYARYQNHYYHYAFMAVPGPLTAICATFCFAIRRELFLDSGGFDAQISLPTVEDEEFGYMLYRKGYKIFLDKQIQVSHLAEYGFGSFIRRKLRMSANQAKNFLRGSKPPVTGNGNHTHHSYSAIASTLLSPLALAAISKPVFALLWLASYAALNYKFWRYLRSVERRHFAKCILLAWLDQFAIFAGLIRGMVEYLLKNRY